MRHDVLSSCSSGRKQSERKESSEEKRASIMKKRGGKFAVVWLHEDEEDAD